MEYTLEDAYDALKDIYIERQKEMEDLQNIITNNEINTLNRSTDLEDIKTKRHKLSHNLWKQILHEGPKDFPFPGTSDSHVEVLTEIQEELRNAQDLLDKTKARLSEINDDIAYLEKKKKGLDSMREAYLGAAEMVANSTYSKEHGLTKRIFQQVKKDLYTVVDTLFPKNDGFKELLAALTCAYTKGGDDLYVDITPEVVDYVHFLIETDIAVYHRNDKNKVRLIDML